MTFVTAIVQGGEVIFLPTPRRLVVLSTNARQAGMSSGEILRSVFVVAAIAEIGGAWLVWQSVREVRGWALALLGGLALFI